MHISNFISIVTKSRDEKMNTWQKILLSGVVVLAFFLGLEGLCWVLLPTDIYQGDIGYFWKLRANLDYLVDKPEYKFQLHTNSLGYRDTEIDEQSPKWLFLGCSTTLGWGVEEEETFVELLEAEMSIQAINAGQPGWSTQQALLNIEEFKNIEADVVVIGFGVRDAQWSNREDKDSAPRSWMTQRNIFRWLGSRKSSSTVPQTEQVHRVSVVDFQQNLAQLIAAFPSAKVLVYAFPQVQMAEEYLEAIRSVGGVVVTGFSQEDFFAGDPIHITPQGHTKLRTWFTEYLQNHPL